MDPLLLGFLNTFFNFSSTGFIKCWPHDLHINSRIHFLSISLNVYLSGLLFLSTNDLLAIKDIDFAEMVKMKLPSHWGMARFSSGNTIKYPMRPMLFIL